MPRARRRLFRLPNRGAVRILERNATAHRRQWGLLVTGIVEPALYLLSIGIIMGPLIGDVTMPGEDVVTYKAFVAPGLMAVAAMNTAIVDTTQSFFYRVKYTRIVRAVLATPLQTADVAAGEVLWATMRGTLYSTTFFAAMLIGGTVHSWWSILAVPASLLVTLAFAGAGIAGATYLRSYVDFDLVNVVLVPMFLFSGVFVPISRYPAPAQWIVRVSPLYQGVELLRALVLGRVMWSLTINAAYLAVMAWIGVTVGKRRLLPLLLEEK